MAVGFPAKTNFATGEVLTATNMNDITGTLNLLQSTLYPAGRNKIINGDFNVNQRAFTSTTTTGIFMFDRWLTNVSDGTVTYTAQTFTPGAAPVAGYEGKNYLRCVTTGQTLTTARANIAQKIESVRTFAGETVTFSFWAKANTGTPEIGIQLQQYFGTGGSPSASVNVTSKVTISTSWARYSLTLSVPSISGKTVGTDNNDALICQFWLSGGSSFTALSGGIGIQSNTFEIWGVQIEAGSTASPFQTASGSIGGELALCQRYYYRAVIDAVGGRLGSGYVNSTVELNLTVPFPVVMRTKPTALEQTGTATDYQVLTTGNTITTCNSVPSISTSTQAMQGVVALGVAAGLVAGQGATMRVATANAYLGWSAEL
jgi:hypothetical protein